MNGIALLFILLLLLEVEYLVEKCDVKVSLRESFCEEHGEYHQNFDESSDGGEHILDALVGSASL